MCQSKRLSSGLFFKPNAKLIVSLTLILLSGCSPVNQQPVSAEASCDPQLASCVEVVDHSQPLVVESPPISREALMARVEELKRWLAWQRAVALGETNEPFESRDKLISDAPKAMTEVHLDAESRLAAIEQLAASGALEQAIQLIEELVNVEPERPENLVLYSALLTRTGEYDRSIAVLDQAIQQNALIPEYYNNQAVNYAAKGDLGKAIELLQTAFSTHPSFAQIQFNLKQLYQATARRALSPLEKPEPPELTPIELRFELVDRSGVSQN